MWASPGLRCLAIPSRVLHDFGRKLTENGLWFPVERSILNPRDADSTSKWFGSMGVVSILCFRRMGNCKNIHPIKRQKKTEQVDPREEPEF